MADITYESAVDLWYGHQSVTCVAQPISPLNLATLLKGILLRAPGANDPVPNTVCVWVGDMRVQANSLSEVGGMPIAPGESLFIPINLVNRLYVVSIVAGQDLAWMAL